jgi:hypothetical protein
VFQAVTGMGFVKVLHALTLSGDGRPGQSCTGQFCQSMMAFNGGTP